MARGTFSGVIVGTLVSALGLGTASVMTSDRVGPSPQAGVMDVPEGSEFNQPREDTTAALPGDAEAPGAGSAPEVSAPEPDDLASLSEGVTEPAAQPETGAAEGSMTAPAEASGEAGVSVDSEDPVLPSPQSQAPEAPAGEEDLSISTDPAQPAMPDVSEDDAAFPDTEEPSDAMAEAVVEDDAEPETMSAEAETAEVAQPEAETATALSDAERTDDKAEMAEPVGDGAVAEIEGGLTEDADVDAGVSGETQALAAASPEPSSTIGDLAPEVKTNRLPSVGDQPDPEADTEVVPETPATETAAAEPEEGTDTRPPLEKYAAEFENPGDKPLMSIVLIDDGSSPVGLQALESFPYPLSFAVAANWDGAEDAMVKYRAAGFEVLALTDLPEGSGPQDAEQAMQAVFSVLSEAVGVMEGTGSGLQSSRAAAEQLAPILLDSGHGVVLFPKGLNTAQKLLAREGVPSAAVFRDFDAKGQNATVIRRFLDQAAFKAGQENAGVVMVGRLRPDTVSALLLWGLQDRANRVTLAPVSALLSSGE